MVQGIEQIFYYSRHRTQFMGRLGDVITVRHISTDPTQYPEGCMSSDGFSSLLPGRNEILVQTVL